MKNLLKLILFLCLIGSASATPYKTIYWTYPCFNAAIDDSGHAYCEDSPDSLHDLGRIEIWGQPKTGGGWRQIVQRSQLHGKECQPDSIVLGTGWNYYIRTFDIVGNEAPCVSNIIYLSDDIVTGVDPTENEILKELFFNVQGRKVEPSVSGIYWKRTWYKDGRIKTERIMILK